jgi:hypothetical protein
MVKMEFRDIEVIAPAGGNVIFYSEDGKIAFELSPDDVRQFAKELVELVDM